MIVRCLHIVDATGRDLAETSRLRIGGEYPVLMISAVPGQEPMIRIHETVSPEETDPHYPALWRSSMFELVSDAMPSNWRVALGGEDSPGYLRIAPTSWLREGFWDDIFDWSPRSEEAREDYSRELETILAESGG